MNKLFALELPPSCSKEWYDLRQRYVKNNFEHVHLGEDHFKSRDALILEKAEDMKI